MTTLQAIPRLHFKVAKITCGKITIELEDAYGELSLIGLYLTEKEVNRDMYELNIVLKNGTVCSYIYTNYDPSTDRSAVIESLVHRLGYYEYTEATKTVKNNNDPPGITLASDVEQSGNPVFKKKLIKELANLLPTPASKELLEKYGS